MNSLMYSMKFGTWCYWKLEKQWKVLWSQTPLPVQSSKPFQLCLTLITNLQLFFFPKHAAIEVIEKQIKKREGVPFLWRLLVKLCPAYIIESLFLMIYKPWLLLITPSDDLKVQNLNGFDPKYKSSSHILLIFMCFFLFCS